MKVKVKIKRRITIRSAKNKGKGFQNQIRDAFLSLLQQATDSDLPLTNDDIESRQMGGAGADIIFHNADAKRNFRYYVECKQGKRGFNPHQIFSDLTELAYKNGGKIPLLFHRRDRHETLVTMPLEEFLRLQSDRIELGKFEESDTGNKKALAEETEEN